MDGGNTRNRRDVNNSKAPTAESHPTALMLKTERTPVTCGPDETTAQKCFVILKYIPWISWRLYVPTWDDVKIVELETGDSVCVWAQGDQPLSSLQVPHLSITSSDLQIEYFNFFYVAILSSTPLYLPPPTLHCIGECWDRPQDCCDFDIGSRSSNHSDRSHPLNQCRGSGTGILCFFWIGIEKHPDQDPGWTSRTLFLRT